MASCKSHRSDCGKSREDLMNEQNKEGTASVDQVKLMNSFIKMALSNARGPEQLKMKKIMEIYEKTPDLEKEFAAYLKAKNIKDISANDVLPLLKESTILNKGCFMHENLFYGFVGGSSHPMLSDRKSILKMINSNSMDKLGWFFSAPQYSVYTKPQDSYSSDIYHSFSNAKARKEVFETGNTHVAVGFVDLSLLLWMDLRETNPGPLKFVGFEMSAFSVAKTLVISSMLKLKEKDIVDTILQVWYSSCWSELTVNLFYRALDDVLSISHDKEVQEILKFWRQSKAPSIQEARSEWLTKIETKTLDPAVNALTSRNTLVQYFLTGQLLPASVGSIVMFQVPPKIKGQRSRDESCFHCLDFGLLATHTKKQNGDFVAGAISLFRQGIQQLHDYVLSGKVAIQIEPPTIVSLDNVEVTRKIRAMKPYTISWNNCLDYMGMNDFHALSRACSAPSDTIHFGYSMNWHCNVKGACSLELPVGNHLMNVMETMRHLIQEYYSIHGCQDLLIFPPIDNPINVLSVSTASVASKAWTKVFFESVPNVGYIEPSMYNPFARSSLNLYFSWTYDPSVSFTGVNPANFKKFL